jgi:hypothetical protein
MKRRATTLVEVLCVLVLLVPVAVMGGQIFHATFSDLSQVGRATSVHSGLDRVMLQVQRDVDAGLAFPDAVGDRRASDQVLLIFQRVKIVCFTAGKDKIVREEFAGDKAASLRTVAAPGPAIVTDDWALPNHKTSFTRIGEPDARAVDVQMHVEVWADGKAVDKFAVARRFCLGGLTREAVGQ